MKIIGNGLIARAFLSAQLDIDECCIFASGVSNSLVTDPKEFEREENLLQIHLDQNPNKFVYFSSCSVAYEKNPYFLHKLRMEELVAAQAREFYVFRLPQVAGVVDNSTLLSFLTKQFFQNRPVIIQKSAWRYLIDINDVIRISSVLIHQNCYKNSVLNIAPAHGISLPELAMQIKKIIKSFSNIQEKDLGLHYIPDISCLFNILQKDDPVLGKDYPIQVINKYVPLLLQLFQSKLK